MSGREWGRASGSGHGTTRSLKAERSLSTTSGAKGREGDRGADANRPPATQMENNPGRALGALRRQKTRLQLPEGGPEACDGRGRRGSRSELADASVCSSLSLPFLRADYMMFYTVFIVCTVSVRELAQTLRRNCERDALFFMTLCFVLFKFYL